MQYKSDPTTIQQALAAFLEILQTEALVMPTTEVPSAPALELDTADLSQAQASFIPPELHRYTDMQDLLLLDPIHEVDETGWPVAIAPVD